MRKIYLHLIILLGVFFCNQLGAQKISPFNYQAVIRKSDGTVIQNQQVTVSLTIQGTGGTVFYSEKQNPQTDVYGVINLLVGNGTVVSGTMESVDWTEELVLKVGIDYDNDGSDDLSGSSSIASVPKAGFAQQSAVANALSYDLALVATSGDYNDLLNQPVLQLDGTALSIDKGNTSVDLSGISTDDQTAAEVEVTPYGNLVATNVQDALNELQYDINNVGGGTVMQVSSGNTSQLTVSNTTSTPVVNAVTAAVADNSDALATGDQVYDFVTGQGYLTTQSDDQTAAEVSNTAAGNIDATDVQAAINELDTEKLANTATFGGDVSGTYNNLQIGTDAVTTTEIGTSGASDANKVLTTNGTGNPQWELKTIFTDDQTAAEVSNTAAGNIDATDVQAAINELDTEKLANAATFGGDVSGTYNNLQIGTDAVTTTEIGTSGASDANKVLTTDGTGNPQWELKAIFTDDQTATEVSNTATGNIDATDVQAAINELDTEKLANTATFGGDVSGTYNNLQIGTDAVTTTEIGTSGASDADKVLTTNGTGNPQWELKTIFTDDQTAAEVAVTPSGNLASTNVRNALLELQGDINSSAFSTASRVTSNALGDLAYDDFVFGSGTLNYDNNISHAARMFF